MTALKSAMPSSCVLCSIRGSFGRGYGEKPMASISDML
jgi:hypothetical protein